VDVGDLADIHTGVSGIEASDGRLSRPKRLDRESELSGSAVKLRSGVGHLEEIPRPVE
jgi:hypothetical protein